MIKNYNEYIKQINEGLIMTHDINQTTNILDSNLNYLISDNYIIKKLTNYSFEIEINFNINVQFIDILFTLINNCGYFSSKVWLRNKQNFEQSYKYNREKLIKDVSSNNIVYIKILCEAKYDQIINNLEYPLTLYHVCNNKNIDKIFKIGLVPKSKAKLATHPERIYLTYDLNDAEHLIKRFDFNSKMKMLDDKYSILKIIINKDDEIILYNDPNFNNKGCYIYDNINKNNITLI